MKQACVMYSNQAAQDKASNPIPEKHGLWFQKLIVPQLAGGQQPHQSDVDNS